MCVQRNGLFKRNGLATIQTKKTLYMTLQLRLRWSQVIILLDGGCLILLNGFPSYNDPAEIFPYQPPSNSFFEG